MLKDKDKPNDSREKYTRSNAATARPFTSVRLAEIWTHDWLTQADNKKWWCQQSHCWTPFTHESKNWLGLCWMHYFQYDYHKQLTLESWFTCTNWNGDNSNPQPTNNLSTEQTKNRLNSQTNLTNNTMTEITLTIHRLKCTNQWLVSQQAINSSWLTDQWQQQSDIHTVNQQ